MERRETCHLALRLPSGKVEGRLRRSDVQLYPIPRTPRAKIDHRLAVGGNVAIDVLRVEELDRQRGVLERANGRRYRLRGLVPVDGDEEMAEGRRSVDEEVGEIIPFGCAGESFQGRGAGQEFDQERVIEVDVGEDQGSEARKARGEGVGEDAVEVEAGKGGRNLGVEVGGSFERERAEICEYWAGQLSDPGEEVWQKRTWHRMDEIKLTSSASYNHFFDVLQDVN